MNLKYQILKIQRRDHEIILIFFLIISTAIVANNVIIKADTNETRIVLRMSEKIFLNKSGTFKSNRVTEYLFFGIILYEFIFYNLTRITIVIIGIIKDDK